MKNGLYSVKFSAQGQTGAGVAALHDGQIRGGDSASYYRGTYTATGGQFTAQVSIRTHFDHPGIEYLLGKEGGEVSLSGTSTETGAHATATSPKLPISLDCHFELVAD